MTWPLQLVLWPPCPHRFGSFVDKEVMPYISLVQVNHHRQQRCYLKNKNCTRQYIIFPPSIFSLGGQLPEKELPGALQVKLYTRGEGWWHLKSDKQKDCIGSYVFCQLRLLLSWIAFESRCTSIAQAFSFYANTLECICQICKMYFLRRLWLHSVT